MKIPLPELGQVAQAPASCQGMRGRVNDEPAEDGFDAVSGPQPIANF